MNNILSSALYTATRPEFMAGIVGLLFMTNTLGTFTINGSDWTWLAQIILGAFGFIAFSRAWIAYEVRRVHAAHDKYAAGEPTA